MKHLLHPNNKTSANIALALCPLDLFKASSIKIIITITFSFLLLFSFTIHNFCE